MPKIDNIYINAAKEANKIYGIPVSVSLAQFALESGYGKHDLGVNNFFGIKYGKNVKADGFIEKKTKEFVKERYVTITAKFAKFDSVEGSFLEHARFLAEHPQLKRAMVFKDNPEKFIYALQDGKTKYATDPKYVEKLLSIIKSNNLYSYDIKYSIFIKVTKKPTVTEAIQWDGSEKVLEFIRSLASDRIYVDDGKLWFKFMGVSSVVSIGYWIIKDRAFEYFIVSDAEFNELYEKSTI